MGLVYGRSDASDLRLCSQLSALRRAPHRALGLGIASSERRASQRTLRSGLPWRRDVRRCRGPALVDNTSPTTGLSRSGTTTWPSDRHTRLAVWSVAVPAVTSVTPVSQPSRGCAATKPTKTTAPDPLLDHGLHFRSVCFPTPIHLACLPIKSTLPRSSRHSLITDWTHPGS